MTNPFSQGLIGGLQLRNRIIKTATYEGMSPGGLPTPALKEHHRAIAAGGVGMTTVAYCSVHETGRTFSDQMVMSGELGAQLRPLVDAVHAEGAAVCLQLAHAGGFSKDPGNKRRKPRGPAGPSLALNRYGMLSGLFTSRAMTETEILAVIEQYGTAARQAKEAGFDAVELHLGHGYLLSQFLSPALNRRNDRWGGNLENRLRLPLAAIARVREEVGPEFPVLAKTNLRDHVRGGLDINEAVAVATALSKQKCTDENLPGVDALVLSGGLVSHSAFYLLRGERPLKQMIEVEKSFAQRMALRLFGRMVIEEIPFQELFFLDLARQVRNAVDIPLVLLGGAVSLENLETAMAEGFEFIAIGRALIENPTFVRDLESGRITRSACSHCNQCVAEMDRGGVRCVLPSSQRSCPQEKTIEKPEPLSNGSFTPHK